MKISIKLIVLFLILSLGVSYTIFSGVTILGAVTGINDAPVGSEVIQGFNDGQQEVPVIVVLKDQPSGNPKQKKEMIKKVQEDVLKNLKDKNDSNNSNHTKKGLKKVIDNLLNKEDHDISLDHKYENVNGFSGEVTKQGLNKLKKDPRVEKIYFDDIMQVLLSDSVPLINADDVWNVNVGNNSITGEGQSVCVVDTGVDYTHPSLGGCTSASFLDGSCPKVIGGYDFVNDDNDPMDDHGHGTHVSGIIASIDSTYEGVANGAKIVAMKVCNDKGSCTESDVIAGMERCLDNATVYNISVVSISLGGGSYTSYCDDSSSFSGMVNTLVENNISVVVAAGNSGSGHISDPACVKNSTRVTATTKSDAIASYASRLDFFNDTVAAPGSSITSLKLGGGTVTMSGTSMATPHVSAAIALMKQYWKLAYDKVPTPQQALEKILLTGKPIYDSSTDAYYPRIDVLALLQPFLTFSENPENNSILSDDSVSIVISSDVDLSLAELQLTMPNGSANNLTMLMSNESSASFSLNLNLSEYDEGTYNYKVYGNDSGNLFGASETRTFKIDHSNPLVNITTPGNGTSLNIGMQSFNVTIDDLNIDSVLFLFDNSSGEDFNRTPANNSGDWNLDLNTSTLAEGINLMTVVAADLVGNINNSMKVSFFIDHSAPNVELISPSNGIDFNISSGVQNFNVSVNDNLSSITSVIFNFDNSSGNDFNLSAVYSNSSQSWSYNYNISLLTGGQNLVNVVAKDTVGNVNDSIYFNFTVKLNSNSSENSTVNGTSISVNLLSPDDNFKSSNSTAIFNCSAESNSNLSNITLYGSWNNWHANETFYVNETNETNETNISVKFIKTIPDGSYLWNCLAFSGGYQNFSSANRTLIIDSTKPGIFNVSYDSLTQSGVEIYWLTDENTNSSIDYGTSLNLGTTSSGNSFKESHSFSFSGLSSSTTYYFNLTSCDSFGNCNTSGIYNFTTNQTTGDSENKSGDNSSNDNSAGNDQSSSSSSSGGSGGSSGGGSGSSGSSSDITILSEQQQESQQTAEKPKPEVQDSEAENELPASNNTDSENATSDPGKGFAGSITGFFSALVPSDSGTSWYVIFSVIGFMIVISTTLLLVHRRRKKKKISAAKDSEKEKELDLSYHKRLP